MRKIKVLLVGLLVLSMNLFAADATMEVVKKMTTAPKVALVDGTDEGFDYRLKIGFYKMLVGDLKVTAHFNPIESHLIGSYDKVPVFSSIKDKPSLTLQYKLQELNGYLVADVKLLNSTNRSVKYEQRYRVAQDDLYPFLSHQVISDLNDRLGMNGVSWMNRYVLFSKNLKSKSTQVVLADYTLTYQKVLINGGLNLFPKWADKEQSRFFYSSFSDPTPTLYEVDLRTKKRTKIISSQGMIVASDVSKDESKLLLTMAPNGQADIYMYNLFTKELNRITAYRGIDVNGGFVDDDKKIIFVSDRLGYPNIFSKRLDSKGVEQMVYHGRNNNASSSYGRYIVYSSRDKASLFGSSTFNLYLISTQTEYIRQLTATGKNLFPRFSNDGTSVLFIKSYGPQSALGLIRLNENKTFHFPLDVGQIQSIDW